MDFVTFLYVLVFVLTAVLGLVSIWIIIKFFKLQASYFELRKQEATTQAEEQKKVEEILTKAQKDATVIIQQATVKAESIIKNVQGVVDSQSSQLAQALATLSEEYKKVYAQSLKSTEVEAVKLVQNIQKDIKIQIDKEINQVHTSLEKDMVETRKLLGEVVGRFEQSFADEMAQYKKQKENQLNTIIFDVVKEISRKVIKKEISEKEHESMVLDALNEAKKEGLFE